jgi:hypothetical protein
MSPRPFSRLAAPLLALLLAPVAVSAATLTCTGTVDKVRTDTDGSVRILPSWRGGNSIALCNVTTAWKGVPVEVCKRLHTAALTAQVTQGSTTTYYGNTTAASCETMPVGTNADAPTQFINE